MVNIIPAHSTIISALSFKNVGMLTLAIITASHQGGMVFVCLKLLTFYGPFDALFFSQPRISLAVWWKKIQPSVSPVTRHSDTPGETHTHTGCHTQANKMAQAQYRYWCTEDLCMCVFIPGSPAIQHCARTSMSQSADRSERTLPRANGG